jgi:hypothetical protein
MSNLYSKKIITLGTLVAVFLATSDEAIPLMISKPEFIPKLLLLLASKVVYAIIMGYLIDGIIALFSRRKPVLTQYHDRHCHDGGQVTYEGDLEEKHGHDKIATEHKCNHSDEDEGGHEHSHSHCCATNIFLDALKHALTVLVYVFIATLIINLIKGYSGGLEILSKIFTTNVYLQILIACVIGLIPNCAASVFLVEMYMEGVILFPTLVAGLCAGAGVGLIVLYTCNYKKVGQNILITLLLYALSVIAGIIVNFFPNL